MFGDAFVPDHDTTFQMLSAALITCFSWKPIVSWIRYVLRCEHYLTGTSRLDLATSGLRLGAGAHTLGPGTLRSLILVSP